mgnify:CR=1 FL=1
MKYRLEHPTCLLAAAFVAVACNSDSSPDPETAGKAPVPPVSVPALPADDAIVAKLYDPSYSVPDGFFVDERAGTPGSYTVYHVKDASVSYELCTDDFSTAERWEADDNAARHVNGYYVGHVENDRYFEFVRELSYDDDVGNIDDLTTPGFSRVFKCSYAVRDGVDRSQLTGYAGRLNARPLDNARLRDFAEYFWQFAFFDVRAKKVLGSYAGQTADAPSRTLLLAFATAQGAGQCDRVEVVEWRFDADAGTGEVFSRFDTVRTFTAEVVDGTPRICSAP